MAGCAAEDGTYPEPLALVCAHCGIAFELWDAVVGTAEAFAVLELERLGGGIRIGCVQHRYEVMRCACGQETAASPGLGVLSFQEGRRRTCW